MAPGLVTTVPEPGRLTRTGVCESVDVLSDEALVAARSRLNPAGRVDAQRAVGGPHRRAGVDHSPSGRRRGVVANNVGRPQHCVGPASGWAPVALPAGRDVVCPVGVAAEEHTRHPEVVEHAEAWRQVAADAGRVAGGAASRWIRMPVPGIYRWSWMSRPPGCCWVRCPRRFMPGCNQSGRAKGSTKVSRVCRRDDKTPETCPNTTDPAIHR